MDDQPHYFTVERLRAIKLAHETWVHATLSSQPPQHLPVRIRRRDARPTSLHLATAGGDLLNLVLGADAYDFDNDDLKSKEEVQLVAEFLQTLHDYAEIDDDLEPGGRVEARFELGKMLEALTEAGFFVYVGTVNHVLEGGVAPPVPWIVATLRVKRAEDLLTGALEAVQNERNQPKRATAS
ncbi:MAG TPA: hypothetical protein VF006_16545 [Longimicrobium sp.]